MRTRALPDRCERRQRIDAYRQYQRDCCISDFRIRRMILKRGGTARFARIRFRVGTLVHSAFSCDPDELYLVVGHAYTGPRGRDRGCFGCRIRNSGGIAKGWQWIGPESRIRKAVTTTH